MGWWTYVFRNVDSLDAGHGFATGTLYAPGQSVASWLILHALDGRDDPAVLRVVFGLVDGCAVAFVVLVGKELLSWAAGLVAGLLYALWPAGASASVNLLHDHSPQPFFALAGLWLVLRAVRLRRPGHLFVAAFLLGLPALFRADGSVVALALALGVAAYVWSARGGLSAWCRVWRGRARGRPRAEPAVRRLDFREDGTFPAHRDGRRRCGRLHEGWARVGHRRCSQRGLGDLVPWRLRRSVRVRVDRRPARERPRDLWPHALLGAPRGIRASRLGRPALRHSPSAPEGPHGGRRTCRVGGPAARRRCRAA